MHNIFHLGWVVLLMVEKRIRRGENGIVSLVSSGDDGCSYAELARSRRIVGAPYGSTSWR